ncbi:MAG: hypothetical protein HUU35_09830 [Armatimonadetes bacterium]|nr:hypothetical protein [Armatimonadota bacterium]
MQVPGVRFDEFYDQAELLAWCEAAVKARPKLAKLHRLTTTPDGHPLLLLEITDRATGPGESKPGYLLHANIHPHELTTITAALVVARDLLTGHGQDEETTALLRRVTFYVVPCLAPDGAEFALKTNGSVRSRSYPRRRPNGLLQADMDGDGQIRWMRWPDPDGDHALHPEEPCLLVRRQPEHDGPFYRLVPEGEVPLYDGGPVHLSERRVDFNRQWPAYWEPEHIQGGAGDFPFSEPEMRAIGEFVMAHRNIYAMLGFHTGGNGVLRPSATRADSELDAEDVKTMRQVGARGAELTGFALFSVSDYCRTYSIDAKLRGHFTDWAYSHLGTLTYEIELGNLYNSAGVTTEQWREATPAEQDLLALDALRWSEAHDYGAFAPWRAFDHPQLGEVEIGGWVRYRLANPALSHLEAIAERCSKFIRYHAALAPWLELRVEVTSFGEVKRLRAAVVNRGELPTNITRQALRLQGIEGLEVSLRLADGVELLSRQQVSALGHLPRLQGKRELEWFVRAPAGGEVTITATCPRAGRVEERVTLEP